jgi:hypothetical protein
MFIGGFIYLHFLIFFFFFFFFFFSFGGNFEIKRNLFVDYDHQNHGLQ